MKMLAAHVSAARAEFELLERDVPEPRLGCVRIKVEACGVCHSDSFTKEGQIPGLAFPRVPGHEVVGVIDKLGSGVVGWEPGERVGVGWFGGSCHRCDPCRRGRMINCIRLETPGVTYDGGYAEFMVAPVDALARVPDGLASADAARPCFAPASPPSMLCGTAARPLGTSLPFTVSAASAISASSSQDNLVSGQRRSAGAGTSRRWRCSLELITIWTPMAKASPSA